MSPEKTLLIAGAGCAGLSLACRIVLEKIPFRQILLVDSDFNEVTQRTWCFWKKPQDRWWCEEVISYRWHHLQLNFNDGEIIFPTHPYEYCHVSGTDFKAWAHHILKKDSRVIWINDCLKSFSEDPSGNVTVIGEKNSYQSDMVFSGIFRKYNLKNYHANFWQQFLGWFLEGEFRKDAPVCWMDFRVTQQNGPAFVYILPFSEKKYLVEYTLFTPQLIPKEYFEEHLEKYLKPYFHGNIIRKIGEEFSQIPMFESPVQQNPYKNIFPIGISGGNIKSSSGFAFYFIQKNTNQIIHALKHQQPIPVTSGISRFRWYDGMVLRLFKKHPSTAPLFFRRLFESAEPSIILKFLNNETILHEELPLLWRLKRFFL